MIESEPLLEFNRVICPGTGTPELNALTLSITPGDEMVIFGLDKSGINLIPSLVLAVIDDYRGAVRYRGRDMRELDYHERLVHKNCIGYMHGDFGLMSNMTVRENIELPLSYFSQIDPGLIMQKGESAMRRCNLMHCRDKRPVYLTHSEILRTAYARAVVQDPDLLVIEHAFVDDPGVSILSVLEDLRRRADDHGKTTLFVTYEPEKFLDFTDDYVMIDEGRIVFRGSSRDFLETDNPYVRQFRVPSREGPLHTE